MRYCEYPGMSGNGISRTDSHCASVGDNSMNSVGKSERKADVSIDLSFKPLARKYLKCAGERSMTTTQNGMSSSFGAALGPSGLTACSHSVAQSLYGLPVFWFFFPPKNSTY